MAGVSHTPEAANSQLFVEDGSPVKFYVDPGSVLGRPKLIRTLKSAGASIASDPKAADLILVQSDVTTGQHFVRDWGAEKTVLETTWVLKTIAAGRLLKESDQWGNCLAVEDDSIDLRELDPGELDNNHLPTPRITPVEPAPNSWPSHGGPQHPLNSPDSRPSSQQPTASSGPPPIFQIPILPNQLSPFQPQPAGQSFYPYQGHQYGVDPQIYAMALMDVINMHGLLPHPGLFPQGPGMQPLGVLPPNSMLNSMQHSQTYSQHLGPIQIAHESSASPHSTSSPLPLSISRKSTPDLKGKGRATSYISRGLSGSSGTVSSSSASAKIFTSDAGQPLTFYVALDLHNRAAALNNIRRHGGQISTQLTADLCVLSSRSRDFESLLETVLSSNGTAVKSAFVLDSVEQKRLMDPDRYQFDLPPKLQRRKEQKASASSPTKPDTGKKNLQKPKSHKKKPSAVVKEGRKSPDVDRVPSPTPPPEHTRVLHHGGNGGTYRYTEAENAYVIRYAEILMERDRHISTAALGAKMHAKMPHHPASGWVHHISYTIRDSVEQVRKRAMIAYRKEERNRQANAEDPPAKRAKSSKVAAVAAPKTRTGDANMRESERPNSENRASQTLKTEASLDGGVTDEGAAAEQQDLNTIAHFFANGGDAEDSDEGDARERVWATLTAQTPCRTAGSWEAFYHDHHDRVMELYGMLVAQQEEEEAARAARAE